MKDVGEDREARTLQQVLAGEHASNKAEALPVSRQRAYSNDLRPVWAISSDFFTPPSIVPRSRLLNGLMLLPLLAAAVLFPRAYIGLLDPQADPAGATILGVAALALTLVALGIAYVVSALTDDPVPRGEATPPQRARLAQPGGATALRESSDAATPQPRDRFAALSFMPMFTAALMLAWVGFQPQTRGLDWWAFATLGAVVHLLGCMWGMRERRRCGSRTKALGENAADIGYIVGGGYVGGFLVYGLTQFAAREHLLAYATLGVPALVFSFWLATVAYIGFARDTTSEMDRQWWSRTGAWWLRICVVWIVGFTLVVYGPDWIQRIPGVADLGPKFWIAGGCLLGIVSGLLCDWSRNGKEPKQRAETYAAATGVRLLYFAAFVAFALLVIGTSCALSGAVNCLAEWT